MSTTFADLGVPSDLVAALAQRGIDTPFPVQAASIPDALAGRDVCGRAPTGSGKTLAFGIPLAARVGHADPGRPRALVLAPTRELAEQIQRELKPLCAARHRRVIAVYGGVGYGPQRNALRKGADVLVACPGRLADLIQQGDVRLGDVDLVVIDEADRMADMGFLPEVRRLLDATASERQTILFSATLDGDVAVLTRDYQRNAVRHEVGATEPDLTAMQHLFWTVDRQARVDHVATTVARAGQTIVFCRTRRGADRVAKQLGSRGVEAGAIHGGRSQGQRDRALRAFTSGNVQALVATDVAARGIHVDDVACVIHFDPPEDAKTYVHRSGRTARAGATGVVVSLVTSDQVRDARRLVRALELGAEVGAPEPASVPSGAGSRPSHQRPSRGRDDRDRRPGGRDSGEVGSDGESSRPARSDRAPRAGRAGAGQRRRQRNRTGTRGGNGTAGNGSTPRSGERRSDRTPSGGGSTSRNGERRGDRTSDGERPRTSDGERARTSQGARRKPAAGGSRRSGSGGTARRGSGGGRGQQASGAGSRSGAPRRSRSSAGRRRTGR